MVLGIAAQMTLKGLIAPARIALLQASQASLASGAFPFAFRPRQLCDCSLRCPDDEVVHDGTPVGRVTSAVPGLALAYVRSEVPDDAELTVGGRPARLH